MAAPKKPRTRAKSRSTTNTPAWHKQRPPLKVVAFVLLFALVGTYFIYQSFAASPSTSYVGWNRYQSTFLSPLDGQGSSTAPVYNNTGCAWNDQDNIVNLGDGSLAGSTSNTICLVSDFDDSSHSQYPKAILYKVYAASDTLDVSLTNDMGNTWHAPPSTIENNQRVWQMCVADPVADAANINESTISTLPIVPNSNGGHGKIVNYTLHLTSTKGTTRKVVAYFEVAQTGDGAPGRTVKTPCPPNDGK